MPRFALTPISAPFQYQKKPDWLRVKLPSGEDYSRLKRLFAELDLHTVCEEAHCPNVGECWGSGTATIMLMGETCTRGCRFCNVKSGNPHGVLDDDEPDHVAEAISKLGLEYIVLTAVCRDDLPDGGSAHIARAINAIKSRTGILLEVLIPDFRGDLAPLERVVSARPDVISHNLETVESLTPMVRDRRAGYLQSLRVLAQVKVLDCTIKTKSSLMLGLGEGEEEVIRAMRDLRSASVDFLTLGQYLQPSRGHLPVVEYLPPDRFDYYRQVGEGLGFSYVASGPLVRSSYRAGEFFIRKALSN